jgi:hypothetical protein
MLRKWNKTIILAEIVTYEDEIALFCKFIINMNWQSEMYNDLPEQKK